MRRPSNNALEASSGVTEWMSGNVVVASLERRLISDAPEEVRLGGERRKSEEKDSRDASIERWR